MRSAIYNTAANWPAVVIIAKARRKPAAAYLAQQRAAARFTAPCRSLAPMLEGWRLSARQFTAEPERRYFVRLALPGEAYAPLAAVCTSQAVWSGGTVFESLVLPVPPEAVSALQDDAGEHMAKVCFDRANRSSRLEGRALLSVEDGDPRIMGLRIERPGAEPDPVDVVRLWSRPNGPGDRVDPAWLERAALTASGVMQ